MRTKTLLCAAVLAAGVASTMAQSNVYSLNVVGYYNVTVPANGKILIGNQLAVTPGGTSDSLSNVITSTSDLSSFYKYNGGFNAYSFDASGPEWLGSPAPALVSLRPGEGGFFIAAAATTLTFVGEVLQGNLTNTLPAGVKVLRTSITPQAGGVTSNLGLPVEALDTLYQFNGGYNVFQGDDTLVWVTPPGEPTNKVGEAFFYLKANGNVLTNWVRNFTVQ